MKIKCPYCSSMFNDTLETCPSCGAPNHGVVRRSGNQPTTIAELQQWYAARGLPSYEVTRFFIGINYKKPRAFGIYRDERTGNFVVYKNKDNGQRAVRYEGTDEAYAVNEIYQRLKQEILQQKSANLNRSGRNTRGGSSNYNRQNYHQMAKKVNRIRNWLLVLLPSAFIGLGIIAVLLEDAPKDGYYQYQNTFYYSMYAASGLSDNVNGQYWFTYNPSTDDWEGSLSEAALPDNLEKNKTAKQYFLSEDYLPKYTFPDFQDSVAYGDLANSYRVNTGYYSYDDRYYYHMYDSRYSGWYYYDDYEQDWIYADYDDIPDDLTHSTVADDFYYTPTWDSSTQISDFRDTEIYQDYLDELEREREEQRSSWEDDDDDDYSWDDNDSWDYDDTDWDSDW